MMSSLMMQEKSNEGSKYMFRCIKSNANIFGMANLNPAKSGLSVIIWSDHAGVLRNKKDRAPRLKIGTNDESVPVSISDSPTVLVPKSWDKRFKKSTVAGIKEGIEYVARNYDIFLKHYNDTNFEFDDEDLYDALRERGEYK